MANGRPAHKYTVPYSSRCQACDALFRAEEEAEKQKVKRPGALLRHVEKSCDC